MPTLLLSHLKIIVRCIWSYTKVWKNVRRWCTRSCRLPTPSPHTTALHTVRHTRHTHTHCIEGAIKKQLSAGIEKSSRIQQTSYFYDVHDTRAPATHENKKVMKYIANKSPCFFLVSFFFVALSPCGKSAKDLFRYS